MKQLILDRDCSLTQFNLILCVEPFGNERRAALRNTDSAAMLSGVDLSYLVNSCTILGKLYKLFMLQLPHL